jgi:hypothetical protein
LLGCCLGLGGGVFHVGSGAFQLFGGIAGSGSGLGRCGVCRVGRLFCRGLCRIGCVFRRRLSLLGSLGRVLLGLRVRRFATARGQGAQRERKNQGMNLHRQFSESVERNAIDNEITMAGILVNH